MEPYKSYSLEEFAREVWKNTIEPPVYNPMTRDEHIKLWYAACEEVLRDQYRKGIYRVWNHSR